MYKLGLFIGNETLKIEYKEFRFHKRLIFLEESDIRDWIINKNWHSILKLAHITLEHYIKEYIPKYMATFANTTKINNGVFYIGVTDSGEITGIPFGHRDYKYSIGNMINEKIITKYIIKIIEQTLTNVSQEMKDSIVSQTVIQIIYLENDDYLIDDTTFEEYIEEYKCKKNEFDKLNDKYNRDKRRWINEISRYKSAINIIINKEDIRKELIDYIMQYNNECLFEVKHKMIERLKMKNDIIFDEGEIYEQKNNVEHMSYWIVRFRDLKINQLITVKPRITFMNIEPESPYVSIMRKYKPLLRSMLEDNIYFGLVKITFPCKNIINDWKAIGYNDGLNMKYGYRDLDSLGNPTTIFF